VPPLWRGRLGLLPDAQPRPSDPDATTRPDARSRWPGLRQMGCTPRLDCVICVTRLGGSGASGLANRWVLPPQARPERKRSARHFRRRRSSSAKLSVRDSPVRRPLVAQSAINKYIYGTDFLAGNGYNYVVFHFSSYCFGRTSNRYRKVSWRIGAGHQRSPGGNGPP
jgi:hypothetical protein